VELPTPQNILIVRTDRIGDVVLSLPMISTLRATFPVARISMLLRSYTQSLAEDYPGLNGILLYDHDGMDKPWRVMVNELRRHKFDTAIIVYPTARLAALMFSAGIPRRIGTGYRWYSFLFTHKVYEHRKTAEKHEAHYNLSLLKVLGCEVRSVPEVTLPIGDADDEEAALILRSLDIRPDKLVAVLHPGSGGSAREWGARNFSKLAQILADDGIQVLVTGGPGESTLVYDVVKGSQREAKPLLTMRRLKTLAAVLKRADVFVGNSTGPLHIAAAVGTPVVGLYPPIVACSPVRWGPLTSRKRIFIPAREKCPRCSGGACQASDCMDLIRPEEVAQAVRELVAPTIFLKVNT
jgi:heptosyltransferase-3